MLQNNNNLQSSRKPKKEEELKKKLNLHYLDYVNKTYSVGEFDMPSIKCPGFINIDYIALYSNISDYFHTKNTAISFYQYDLVIDGKKSLWNAIYYNDTSLLKQYKERFKDIKYIIEPDFSQIGDINKIENIYRKFKSRIISLWFTFEINALVIPNITYSDEKSFEYMLDGIEDTEVVSLSVKGSLKNINQKNMLIKAIDYFLRNLKKLKKIIIYSVSKCDDEILKLFEHAIRKGIIIIIPDNILRQRNIERIHSNGEI